MGNNLKRPTRSNKRLTTTKKQPEETYNEQETTWNNTQQVRHNLQWPEPILRLFYNMRQSVLFCDTFSNCNHLIIAQWRIKVKIECQNICNGWPNKNRTHKNFINEIKVTSTNIFIDNLFALESEKESKNDERTLFWDYPRIFDLSVNP